MQQRIDSEASLGLQILYKRFVRDEVVPVLVAVTIPVLDEFAFAVFLSSRYHLIPCRCRSADALAGTARAGFEVWPGDQGLVFTRSYAQTCLAYLSLKLTDITALISLLMVSVS